MKHVAVIGSTGSIGRQTIEIIRDKREQLSVVALAVDTGIDELEKQIRELEDTDIIGMVRENGMTMEQFAELFRRMQGAPAPITSEQEEPSHE